MSETSEETLSDANQRRLDQILATGYLDVEVTYGGMKFGLRTLNGEDELIAGLLAKPYLESFAQLKAWAWANVGLALTHVDGDTEFCPALRPGDRKAYAAQRFAYVTDWAWPWCEFLFEEYKQLEAQRDELLEEMREKSLRSPQTSTGSRDSSIEQGDSQSAPEILGLV